MVSTHLATPTLQTLTGYHLRRASKAVQADLASTLKPLGLRMITFSALTVVAENPGLSQSSLAAALEVERPNMVGIVDQLVQAGWVRRAPAPQDARAHALRLTAAGDALLRSALAEVRAHEARLLDGLDPAIVASVRTLAHHLGRPVREEDR